MGIYGRFNPERRGWDFRDGDGCEAHIPQQVFVLKRIEARRFEDNGRAVDVVTGVLGAAMNQRDQVKKAKRAGWRKFGGGR